MEFRQKEVTRLDKLAHLNAWIGTNDKIISLDKAGEGNMNRVVRAQLQSGSSIILKESLPYVAKYPEIAAPIERIEVEAAFYQAVKGTSLMEHTPEMIGFDADGHCLCLADLGNGTDLSTLYTDRLSEESEVFSNLLTWLSTLHQLNVPNPRAFTNSAMRALNHTHIFVLPFEADNGLELSDELTTGRIEIFSSELIESAHDLGQLYLDENPSHGVLLHGDFYPGSWLQTNESFAIIDPEFGFFGPPEFDLGVFTAHLLLAGYSHEEAKAIAAQYLPPIDLTLMLRFAGIEVLRRLFGVAQLPLAMHDDAKLTLASTARQLATT